MENRGIAFVASCLALVGLLGYNAIANDLTTWGYVASVATGVLGMGTLYVVIAKDNLTIVARTLAAGLTTSLAVVAAFGVFGSIYQSSSQRTVDQANAQIYSTDEVTIAPDCVVMGQLPKGASLQNSESLSDGPIDNRKGSCTLTIDRTGNYVRLLPTQDGMNALDQTDQVFLPSRPSELVVEFPANLQVHLRVYNPDRARTQGAERMPDWVSIGGQCSGCLVADAYSSN